MARVQGYGQSEAVFSNGGNNVISMPTFAEVLDAEETRVLATYVRDANGW